MEKTQLTQLLQDVAQGAVSVEDARLQLQMEPFSDLGFAKPDLHRGLRQGAGEVIYGQGKTAQQIAGIIQALMESGQGCILATRVDSAKAQEVCQILGSEFQIELGSEPEFQTSDMAKCPVRYYPEARCLIVGQKPKPGGNGTVVVACAGTSDLYCAEEAALTAECMGSRVTRLYDVGVAGMHRLLAHTQEIMTASVIVAVAGMEGALASVIGGMASCPVIAVPTSVGYGASFGGVSALLSMLNSCASGVSVVNIDNGFGGGYQAALIDHAGQ